MGKNELHEEIGAKEQHVEQLLYQFACRAPHVEPLQDQSEASPELGTDDYVYLENRLRTAAKRLLKCLKDASAVQGSEVEGRTFLQRKLVFYEATGYGRHRPLEVLMQGLRALLEPSHWDKAYGPREGGGTPATDVREAYPGDATPIPWHGGTNNFGRAFEVVYDSFVHKGPGKAGLRHVPFNEFLDRLAPLFADAETGKMIKPRSARSGTRGETEKSKAFATEFENRMSSEEPHGAGEKSGGEGQPGS
jgi:hypothetical protein